MSSSQLLLTALPSYIPFLQFAIKNIDISDHKRKDQLLTEVIVMRDLNHPNLVNYVELFLERDNLMMVMEFMQVSQSLEMSSCERRPTVQGGALTDVVLYTILNEPQIAAVTKEVRF